MTPDLARLRATLGRPDLAWIIDRARKRLERGASLRGTVILQAPTAEQRSALERLLGRSPKTRGDSLSADLEALAEVLRRAEICDGLEEAVEALAGPVIDRKDESRRVEEGWLALFREAAVRCASRASLCGWLEELESSGLLRRLAKNDIERGGVLLRAALGCLERLPARGVPIAELAAAATGDSHALDPGEPLATLVLRAVERLVGAEAEAGAEREMGLAEARRHSWASAGVLLDDLSAPVLVLNLRPAAGDPALASRALALHAEEGEPYRLSVRQLLRGPPRFDASATPLVHVCENPTVVAAAASRLGSRCAPLVAIEGQPKTAGRLLLSMLSAAGIRLRYHGDFDWPGIRIANLVITRHGAEPWRLGAADYLAAARGGGRPLEGEAAGASWDPELPEAMVREGRAVHEEQVLGELLGDLESGA